MQSIASIIRQAHSTCTCSATHTDTQMPSDLFKLCEEVVDHVLDLRSLGGEQDELLIGQVELQHVLRRNGHKQDVRVAEREVMQSNSAVSDQIIEAPSTSSVFVCRLRDKIILGLEEEDIDLQLIHL